MQRTTLLVLGVLVATVAGRYVPVKKYSGVWRFAFSARNHSRNGIEYTKSDGEEYALGIGQVTAFGGLLLWVSGYARSLCLHCTCTRVSVWD
jgi:uncharacterized protein (UPF0333 family)